MMSQAEQEYEKEDETSPHVLVTVNLFKCRKTILCNQKGKAIKQKGKGMKWKSVPSWTMQIELDYYKNENLPGHDRS